MTHDEIIERVGQALTTQFETYSWEQMIDDALEDASPVDREWAKRHLDYKLVVLP